MRHLLLVILLSQACLAGIAPDARGADVRLSGSVDLVYRGGDRRSTVNTNTAGDSPFNDLRLRLFLDAWPSDRLGVMAEVLFDETGGSPTVSRIDGAYAVFMGLGAPWINLKAGKIPSSFGTWAPRSYSDRNPLIGLPLMYHHHTIARNDRLPANFDTLQSYRPLRSPGRGGGMTLIYDACWNTGIAAFGAPGKFEYGVGMTKGALSSMRAATNDGFQFLGRVGMKPRAGLRFGVSGVVAPYLGFGARGVPPGRRLEDYRQKAVGLDLEYSYAHLVFYSEWMYNRWDTPFTSKGLPVTSWYVEWKYTFWPGLYGAVRYSASRFGKVDDGRGSKRAWDSPVNRTESGIGFHVSRAARLKIVWQRTYQDGEADESVNLYAGQLSLSF